MTLNEVTETNATDYDYGDDKHYVFVVDFLASRYGWSVEYIDELPVDFTNALLKQGMLRPHFLMSSTEEEVFKGQKPKFPKSFLKAREDGIELTMDNLDFSAIENAKSDLFTEEELEKFSLIKSTSGGAIGSLLKGFGFTSEQLKEARAIASETDGYHEEIDKWTAVMMDESRSPEEKNGAMFKIFELSHRIEEIQKPFVIKG